MSNDDDSMFSRPRNTNPLGKCDCRLDIPVPEQLLENIIALATLNGMTKAEYGRLILERHVYGELSMVRSVAVRHTSLNGTNQGQT